MTNPLVQRYWKSVESCVLFHLQGWWVVRLVGKDTVDLLQRLGTADVRGLTEGQATQTLFLGGDGRIVADCHVVARSADECWLISVDACGQQLVDLLNRFIFTEDVVVERLDPDYYAALVIGPSTPELLSRIGSTLDRNQIRGACAETVSAEAGTRGVIIMAPQDFAAVRSEFYRHVEEIGGVIGDVDLYHTFRIEAGIPEFGVDTSAKTIPLEARLKPAISFTKGCFPGQEIVARINNLGHPANVLVGFKVPESSVNLAGQELFADGKSVGRLTSLCFSPALGTSLALGYTKWNYREPGQVLTIGEESTLMAEVVSLPIGLTA